LKLKGNFGYSKDRVCISNIDLEIKEKSLVCIVGDIGSGKTSLLNAILGEMNVIDYSNPTIT
jgi:ABC-type cobalamin/Fe3+-siderophores transport system ATPase subunit